MKIDPIVFDVKFPHRCRLERCKSQCCRGGVWADLAERDLILRNAGLFLPYVRPEARDPSTWFGDTTRDPDCPSGTAVETNVAGDYCILFHPDHGCALQKAAVALGRHEWEFKPRFCIMFPLVVSEGVLTVDEDMDEVWCMQRENRTHPILSAVEREVHHLFPDEIVRALLPGVCPPRRKVSGG